jgi:hypothetical protein
VRELLDRGRAPEHRALVGRHVLSGPRVPGGSTGLGHGPILSNTLAWVRMANLIGAQERRAGA